MPSRTGSPFFCNSFVNSGTAIAFGKSFGYCNNDEDRYDYIKTTEASFPILAFVTALPMLGRLFTSTVFRTFVMPNANDKIGLGKAMG